MEKRAINYQSRLPPPTSGIYLTQLMTSVLDDSEREFVKVKYFAGACSMGSLGKDSSVALEEISAGEDAKDGILLRGINK